MNGPPPLASEASLVLQSLGRQVQRLRKQERLTRQALALRSRVSVRFLAQLEAGHNISIDTLALVAAALSQRPSELLRQAEEMAQLSLRQRRVVALIGLRGAGKSTIGRELGARLGRPFVELDERIEEAARLPLREIFALHGEDYYRRLEREVLQGLLGEGAGDAPLIVATGGGLVTAPATYELLQRQAVTVWLRARPEDHWDRVMAQGDHRPMDVADGAARARAQLEELLRAREPLYQKATLLIDTSALGIEGAVDRISRWLSCEP